MLRTLVGGAMVVVLLAVFSVSMALAKKNQKGDGKEDGKHKDHVAAEKKGANHKGEGHEGNKGTEAKKHGKKASSQLAHGAKKKADGDQSKPNMPVNLVPAHADHHGGPAPIDKREKNQEKRIEQGIHKGALTQQERTDLAHQHDAILAKEKEFRSDGKLSTDERKQLQGMLNDSSRMIWAEKHDTQGKQLAVHAFGKNVFAKDDLIKKVSDPNLSAADAKGIYGDYRTMLTDRRKLSEGSLSESERAKLQSEYNGLLNRYFEVRSPNAE